MKRNDISVEIGNRIRLQRSIKHISQEKLAFEAEMHPSYLGCIERGEKCPTIETLYKISKALNIPISKLVEIEYTENELRRQQEFRINAALKNIPTEKLSGAAALIEQLSELLTDNNI